MADKKKIDIEKLTKLAAEGDATAKQQLAEYEWQVGDKAFVRMFGKWEELKITRYDNSEDKLNEQEIEQLLWLCTEFDGQDEDLLGEALGYCTCDGGEYIFTDIEYDDLSDEYLFMNLCFGNPFDGEIHIYIQAECYNDSNKMYESEGTIVEFEFCNKEYVELDYAADDNDEDEECDD